ncbi:unnamed protein product [Linum tenue]|uniref:Uncharacterized protein n=1 Tax=Linum tenue TaxID=586396 RepID=A0AAV0LKT0_9ROSI|nr:unnamed protein product [Linum tenue]
MHASIACTRLITVLTSSSLFLFNPNKHSPPNPLISSIPTSTIFAADRLALFLSPPIQLDAVFLVENPPKTTVETNTVTSTISLKIPASSASSGATTTRAYSHPLLVRIALTSLAISAHNFLLDFRNTATFTSSLFLTATWAERCSSLMPNMTFWKLPYASAKWRKSSRRFSIHPGWRRQRDSRVCGSWMMSSR